MSPLWGSHGAFLSPQFTRMSPKSACKPCKREPVAEPAVEQGMVLEAGGAQQCPLGHFHPSTE